MVIEDDKQLQSFVDFVLRRKGFEVLVADDGAAGLSLARSQPFDLILCDVEMPHLNGSEVLKALRHDPATSDIPFIIMTGRPDKTSMRAGMAMGADDYLPKPFRPEDLVAAIQSRLDRQQQIRSRTEAQSAQLRADLGKRLPHELLTPLTGILGMAELIRADFESFQPADILDMVGAIEKSGLRLLHLIQNYLLHAELETANSDPEYAALFAGGSASAVRAVIETAARMSADRHSRLSDLVFELADGKAAIREDLLSRMVGELVDNACKFSTFGTPVEVRASWQAGQYVLTVADHGRGMSAEQVDQVGAFRQFERDKYEQQGMGLGLALVKRLAEVHRGSFKIASQLGAGTTVEIRLPA